MRDICLIQQRVCGVLFKNNLISRKSNGKPKFVEIKNDTANHSISRFWYTFDCLYASYLVLLPYLLYLDCRMDKLSFLFKEQTHPRARHAISVR